MNILRRTMIAALVAGLGNSAVAHHGWRWTDGGQFELTGVVTEARLGNPHGLLTITAEGQTWIAEVGQPWRNEQAGLTEDMLAPGAELTVLGERSADPSERRMKAEVVVTGGQSHVLYPDRV